MLVLGIQLPGFKPYLSQTNDGKVDTDRFQPNSLALLGMGKEWLAHCQGNVTECDIMSWAGLL